MMRGDQCREAVAEAIEMGYRHIDTAMAYENQREIGEALRGYDRDKLFLTSKISLGVGEGPLSKSHVNFSRIRESVRESVEITLDELGADYLDLMLIHWPKHDLPWIEVAGELQDLTKTGLLRYAGVSNCTEHHLQDAYDAGVSISFNQVEFHPYLYQKKLLSFAEAHATRLIAYRPFGKGSLPQDESLFASIGDKYGKTAGQVILRWIIQKNIPVVPKASSPKHLEENIASLDFTLSEEDVAAIDSLNKNRRYCDNNWNEFSY